MSLQFDQSPINSPGASFTTVGPGGMVNNSQQYTTNTSNLRQRPDNRQKNSNFGIVNLTLGNSNTRGDDAERTDCPAKLVEKVSPGASYDVTERGNPPLCHEETRKVVRRQRSMPPVLYPDEMFLGPVLFPPANSNVRAQTTPAIMATGVSSSMSFQAPPNSSKS
ncbi:hypothetical protein BDN72DRAFT_486773 [Pluteus cervinus]|uniref:Uncharacterized protein n=1 Tax=Pluteus cervinus TaxID=181527 RepID=A0ACD3AZ38_9AGAR|nr:hypothetical protein BDN72DRAFT_486773 [Pluteus cervinus]